jgi:hypothetical protein
MRDEADITINGTRLNNAEPETMRLAIDVTIYTPRRRNIA